MSSGPVGGPGRDSPIWSLRRFLSEFEPDRVEDAVADAQAAVLSISSDAELSSPQARGYLELRVAAGRGLTVLEESAESS